MPYPSPITYPSPFLHPGFGRGSSGRMVSIGGVLLGDTDDHGVRWTLNRLDGWDDSPESTLALTQRARAHGSTGSEPFMVSRYMTAEGHIHADSLESLEAAMVRLRTAVSLQPFQLLVAESSGIKNCMAQRKGAVLINPITDTTAHYSALIVAKDPRKFGDLITLSTRLPFSSGGLTFPVTFPVTFTGVSGTGKVTINNPGNEQAPVWLRIDGPIPAGGWTVTHLGKKQSLTFATALALANGEFVTVDMDRREVLAMGQAPRSGYVTSRGWFSLDPGDNDIAFSAANYSSTASLTVTTKPSWS
jgi:hypothetical protein